MDFELNEDQSAIIEAVDRLLEQHAGPARAITLNEQRGYDSKLHQALEEAGFSNIINDMASGERLGGLEATLVVEAAARAAASSAVGAQLMVAPLANDEIPGPVAVSTEQQLAAGNPVRFGAHANTLLVIGDKVQQATLNDGDMENIRTSFGYPYGKPAGEIKTETLDADAQQLKNWWRLSLAAEAVGTMEGALNHTVDYVKQRRQFGRTIGSFQAIQHRLALCSIQLEGSRWLVREAAYHGASAEGVAAAASFALAAADQVFTEGHQMSGAIGFTNEFDLHVWSMRLQALRQEMEGVRGHRKALVDARWKQQA
jgi:alkylation response protein AidB-like acyl-CoA dehydrogenase